VVAGHQVGHVQKNVLLEVRRAVELTRVVVADDDADLGVVAAGGGLPGLQADGERALTLDLEGLGESDGVDDGTGGNQLVDLGVRGLGEGDRHENSQCLRLGVVPPSLCLYLTPPSRQSATIDVVYILCPGGPEGPSLRPFQPEPCGCSSGLRSFGRSCEG
jgi:hypothetical protein